MSQTNGKTESEKQCFPSIIPHISPSFYIIFLSPYNLDTLIYLIEQYISWVQRNTVVTAFFSEMYFFAVLTL